jgi:hypothetical protein
MGNETSVQPVNVGNLIPLSKIYYPVVSLLTHLNSSFTTIDPLMQINNTLSYYRIRIETVGYFNYDNNFIRTLGVVIDSKHFLIVQDNIIAMDATPQLLNDSYKEEVDNYTYYCDNKKLHVIKRDYNYIISQNRIVVYYYQQGRHTAIDVQLNWQDNTQEVSMQEVSTI